MFFKVPKIESEERV